MEEPILSTTRVAPAAPLRVRPNFKRPLLFGLPAAATATVVLAYGGLSGTSTAKSISLVGCVVFTTLAVLTVRATAAEIARVSESRFGGAHASVLGLLVTLAGYVLTTSVLLLMLEVPGERLLVSGAATGVILGIAAQQSLANVVAGLVLLLNRPFRIGDDIVIHSGGLGGPHEGRVLGIGLTYVRIDTGAGMLSIPNSGLLASVVGQTALTTDGTGWPLADESGLAGHVPTPGATAASTAASTATTQQREPRRGPAAQSD